jgi:hypothetical protein
MPCIIRQQLLGRYENFLELAENEWRLRPQVEALEAWLVSNPTALDPAKEWVADIGFMIRSDAAGGGPPISRKLMEMCLAANLVIFLSEYPGEI